MPISRFKNSAHNVLCYALWLINIYLQLFGLYAHAYFSENYYKRGLYEIPHLNEIL